MPTQLQIPGFAVIGGFNSQGDSDLAPQVSFSAVPSTAAPNAPIYLIWSTLNVGQLEITGTNGVDYIGFGPFPTSPLGFDTGRITAIGSGIYPVTNGFTQSITLTLTCYDATGHPLVPPLSATAHIVIS
jgi:hypothetical protein